MTTASPHSLSRAEVRALCLILGPWLRASRAQTMFLLPTSSLGWASAPDQCPGSAMLALGKYGVVSKLGLSIPTARALPCSGTPRFQHGRSHPIFETHFRWVLFLREASLTSHSKEAPRPSPIFTLLYIFFFFKARTCNSSICLFIFYGDIA